MGEGAKNMLSTFNFLEEAAGHPPITTTIIFHKDDQLFLSRIDKSLKMLINTQYRSGQVCWHIALVLAFKGLEVGALKARGQPGLYCEILSLK